MCERERERLNLVDTQSIVTEACKEKKRRNDQEYPHSGERRRRKRERERERILCFGGNGLG